MREHFLHGVRVRPSPEARAAAMLRLLRAASHHPPLGPPILHRRLLSAATDDQFVAEDYLAAACGLAPAQAARASKSLGHLRSRSNPDAVRAFLDGAGLAKADVAAAIARDARFLCSSVDQTLSPKVAQLRDIGLSPPEISRLVALAPYIFTSPSKISNLAFYLTLLRSFDRVMIALKVNSYLLSPDIENVVKPNMAFLKEQCCLSDSEMADLFTLPNSGKLISMKPECLNETLVRAERLGISRYSGVFKIALLVVTNLTPERITAKMEFLKMALGCPGSEQAVCKCPTILCLAEDRVRRAMMFLKAEVGLEPGYIARRPALLSYSLEKRLMPRHYAIKVLKVKSLVKTDRDFYAMISLAEKAFRERFIARYNECVPGLADAYAAGVAGQMIPLTLM